MGPLPQVLINGRAFFIDERLREIRAVKNPHEVYLLKQDIIPPAKAPAFRLPDNDQVQGSKLAAHIRGLLSAQPEKADAPPKAAFKNIWQTPPDTKPTPKTRSRGK
ncbi:hypothetical protein [Hyphomicrobium sp. CS1BSMeth3]|uniref:hypothetical protein n=1 Tax=Hyphomicrobium sp. CS1BSMeth3 TaxID=1892844 RepID=UPI000930AB80|nr:hypothetical protein [Hyphomicrobium sp. CS1BSMeth3]